MAILTVSIKEAGYEEKQPIIQHIQFSLQKGEWIGSLELMEQEKAQPLRHFWG